MFDLDLVACVDRANNHAGCYIVTDDADDWHTPLVTAGLRVTGIEDVAWGMHEFTLTDQAGNITRVDRAVLDA